VQTVLLRSILIQLVRKRKSGERLTGRHAMPAVAGIASGLSFVEVLITLASKDSPTTSAGHVACAAFATMPEKPKNHSASEILSCALALSQRVGPSAGRAREAIAAAQTFG